MKHLIHKIKLKLGLINPRENAEHLRKMGLLNAGENCEVYGNVGFGSEPYLIKIGNKVRITKGVQFINHDGGLWVIRNLGWRPNGDKMGTIKLGDNVFIGINSTIMPNVIIGSNVIVGTGSIVTKDIPDNSIAVGAPARVISTIDEFYEKHKNDIDDTKEMNVKEKKEYYIKKFF